MDPNELSGGIPSRISGLLFSLFRHVLALGELAAEETRHLIRQGVTALLLVVALVAAVLIAYLALLASVVTFLVLGHGWGWPAVLAVIGLFHFLLALAFLLFLITRPLPRPYEVTAAEIRRDLESLGNYSGKSIRPQK